MQSIRGFVMLINYCIARKDVLQGRISPLGCCNFLCCLGVYFILFTVIRIHFIQMKAVGLCWLAALFVATQMVRKQFPSLCNQFFWFHTEHCMGVLIGFVELGIIF